MNKSRTDFKINKEFKITPYWLLGFVEGEGSFFISKGKGFHYKSGFSLSQSKVVFNGRNKKISIKSPC